MRYTIQEVYPALLVVHRSFSVEIGVQRAYSGSMGTTESSTANSLLRRLLAFLSQDWLSLLPDIYHVLRQVLPRQQTGMYEILDYDTTLELLDNRGKTALFHKRQKVKFLQDNIIAFEDYVWGDGDILADYKCTPGVVADKYREGDRWNILISLRGTKSSGDIEQFYIEQKSYNTYLKDEEWLQTEIRRNTRHLIMKVIFPKNRPCKRMGLAQRSINKSVELGAEHFDILPDGRQMVSWETSHARPYEIYTLKWKW